jgi:penicillin-binding protein 1A
MAQGFSVFANGGKKLPITAILRVENRDGDILMDNSTIKEAEEVLDPQVAYLITDILSDSSARGEGWNSRLQLNGRQNASKTGTSNKRINNITYPLDA